MPGHQREIKRAIRYSFSQGDVLLPESISVEFSFLAGRSPYPSAAILIAAIKEELSEEH